ncbi:MAG: DUF924 domain-containing protein [Rhodocyclales bacterium]|nr:DUF924 domain-containing protein [Rhodocyclales bacterium]
MSTPEDILDFWFLPAGTPGHGEPRTAWFRKDAAFDEEIRARFLPAVEAALAGGLADWAETPRGALALLILLDQFPRNLFRGQAKAFAGDARARQIAEGLVARGGDRALNGVERVFAYLPFEHSEALADQERSLQLFSRLAEEADGFAGTLDYARRHHEVIVRFGRFPHRNAALGRASTAAEADYLAQPGSGF